MFCCNVHLQVDYISACIMNAVYKDFCSLAVIEVYLGSMAGVGEMIPMGTSHKRSMSLVATVWYEWTLLPLPPLTSRTPLCSHFPNADWFHKARAYSLLLTEWLFLWRPEPCTLPAICSSFEGTVIWFSSSIPWIFGFPSLSLVEKSFYFQENNKTKVRTRAVDAE